MLILIHLKNLSTHVIAFQILKSGKSEVTMVIILSTSIILN